MCVYMIYIYIYYWGGVVVGGLFKGKFIMLTVIFWYLQQSKSIQIIGWVVLTLNAINICVRNVWVYDAIITSMFVMRTTLYKCNYDFDKQNTFNNGFGVLPNELNFGGNRCIQKLYILFKKYWNAPAFNCLF